MSQQRPLQMVGGNHPGDYNDTTFTKIFVGGLAWETQRDTMRRYFEQFGEILEAVVITDKNTGRSKGYGFVRSLYFGNKFFVSFIFFLSWVNAGLFWFLITRSRSRILKQPCEHVKTHLRWLMEEELTAILHLLVHTRLVRQLLNMVLNYLSSHFYFHFCFLMALAYEIYIQQYPAFLCKS